MHKLEGYCMVVVLHSFWSHSITNLCFVDGSGQCEEQRNCIYHGLSDQKCKVHRCAKLNPSTSKMAKHRTRALGHFRKEVCLTLLLSEILPGSRLADDYMWPWSGTWKVEGKNWKELAVCFDLIAKAREMVGLSHNYCITQNTMASSFYVSLEEKCLIHHFSLKYPHGYD